MTDHVSGETVEELGQLPLQDTLKHGEKLINVLTYKLQDLDYDKFEDQLLESRIRLILSLLRESLSDRYQDLSLLAFAHIIVAMDYFIRVDDELPDTADGGYADDLKVVQKVFTEFESEIKAFKAWQARQPKNDLF